MLKFCSLSSGSTGNCLFLQSESAALLIDCGISCKKTVELLNNIGVNISNIDAVLVTHEHTDHTAGLRVLEKKYNIPIYIKEKTYLNLNCELISPVIIDGDFRIKDIDIHSFSTFHDAADPIAYSFVSDKSKITVVTDSGIVNSDIVNEFNNADFGYVEANHDIDMLMYGTYTYPLKRRILSDKGHLSNKACSELVCAIVITGTSKIMLGHISCHNNTPEIAYSTVSSALELSGLSDKVELLTVAPKNYPSEIITV